MSDRKCNKPERAKRGVENYGKGDPGADAEFYTQPNARQARAQRQTFLTRQVSKQLFSCDVAQHSTCISKAKQTKSTPIIQRKLAFVRDITWFPAEKAE